MTLDTQPPAAAAPVHATWVHPGPLARAALPLTWLATRAAMLALLATDGRAPLGVGGVAHEVHTLYAHWYVTLAGSAFPAGDPMWQYPPGAGPVLLAPGLVPGLTYFQAFVALTLATDALVTLALARTGARPRRSTAGAWLWVAGLPLLLHIPLARYDIEVTALAVFALLLMGRFPRAGGILAACGALVKVWPALALLGTPRGPTSREAWTAAATSAAAILLVLSVAFRSPFSFLRHQGERGVQIESLGGTVLAFARRAGWSGHIRYRYGAMEYVGPHVGVVAAASLVLTAVAAALLLFWRLRALNWSPATPYDAALCAVLLFTVTSRVLSPQYLIWLLGLAAVCLTSRHTTQRPVALLVVAAAGLSALAYPVLYRDVEAATWTGSLLMLARNGLLLGAAVLSFRALWKGTKA
ncbi:glycosyltransferase 87 family protein [Streptomyces sp. NPDC058321]|uniref:glycosyltransferase 87 family protein n=1 Tax=unclassified Streptomyces TaxID=2593676 RepID=UPI0022576890|nr:glycosyltransferase 87 family protein [Streptomyces sp. NBC_00063]MCX5437698.1 glycosyltransferase 87 family protein [Streptomyces sp. NBC_00063]